jgi:hypothetical protein
MEERRQPSGSCRRDREITPFLVMDILEQAQELGRAGERQVRPYGEMVKSHGF